MLLRSIALAVIPLALFLTGCATPSQPGYGEDASGCRSKLRACLIQGPGMLNNVRIGGLRTFFASAVYQAKPTPDECDIAFSFPATFSDKTEVFSAYTGKSLAHYNTNGFLENERAACEAFADPEGDLYKRMLGETVAAPRPRRAAPPADSVAAPASAPALPAVVPPNFTSPARPDDLAVVVGIETYSDIAAKASYAERDADAFKSFVVALGVPERNVVLLKGSKAGRASIVKNVEQWLPRMVKPDSRVYFYFSGHGAPDVKTGQAYLVPWDGDPNFLESTAYPVAQLYQKLGALPARQVLVAMDSCFSGAGGRSVLASGARPLVTRVVTGAVPAKLTVLAASAADEISGALDDKGHGAFTYFLLQGLDAGKTTPKELVDYLTPRVQDEARRLNRDQTPQLQGDGSWPLR